MVERGTVVGKENGFVLVRVARDGSCDRCGLCRDGDGLLRAESSGLAVGEKVEVEIPDGELAGIALRLYLVPAFAFTGGLAAAALLLGEAWSLPGGLLCLVPAAFFMRRRTRRGAPKVTVRRLDNEKNDLPEGI